jgi:hypothetical protein
MSTLWEFSFMIRMIIMFLKRSLFDLKPWSQEEGEFSMCASFVDEKRAETYILAGWSNGHLSHFWFCSFSFSPKFEKLPWKLNCIRHSFLTKWVKYSSTNDGNFVTAMWLYLDWGRPYPDYKLFSVY